MVNGNLSNIISHIKNCVFNKKHTIKICYSKYKLNMLTAFAKLGFVERLCVISHTNQTGTIMIQLKRVGKMITLRNIRQISKPGGRVYWNYKQIKSSKHALVISTSKGIMDNISLKKLKIGGEVLCKLI